MHGTGTTFISLILCNFLHSKLGRKTAYVELNTANEICTLSPHTEKSHFSYKGIHVFPCKTVTSLPEIFSMDYEYFILDMGILNAYTLKEFLRCDKQFLVCSLCKWKKAKTLENIRNLFDTKQIQKERFVIIDNLGKKESNLTIFSGTSFMVLPFPFVENPFHLDTGLFSDLNKILKGV